MITTFLHKIIFSADMKLNITISRQSWIALNAIRMATIIVEQGVDWCTAQKQHAIGNETIPFILTSYTNSCA